MNDKRRISVLVLEVDAWSEGLKGRRQGAYGALVHSFHAVNAEGTVSGGKNRGKQTAGRAGFSHLTVERLFRPPDRSVLHALYAPAAVPQILQHGAGGLENVARAFQIGT